MPRFLLCLLTMSILITASSADDPAQVGYPPALRTQAGEPVTTLEQWKKRRIEIMELYRQQVYGLAPAEPEEVEVLIADKDEKFLNGKATRLRLQLTMKGPGKSHTADVMIVVPSTASKAKPCPVFLGLNFCGNHGLHSDPNIPLSTRWMPAGKGVIQNKATEDHRGIQASRWPLEQIIEHGFGIVTAYYGDFEEDHVNGWKNGVRNVFPLEGKLGDQLPPHGWGAIAAWAWGLSRMMDALESVDLVDLKRVYLHGHSRLGKTALWAGACDERFAMVISNNSGEGGAAIARRLKGERTADLNRVFPHWFCKNFHQYSGKEETLPVDQHMLVAAIAPRPVYIASASDDAWADPEGEFLAGVHADPVYQLHKLPGLGTTTWPGVQTPVGQTIRYHLREGKHDVTLYDWQQWMQAAPK
ncbi:MAG: hypothetical protein U0796_01910 [Gemmatales bacterium]